MLLSPFRDSKRGQYLHLYNTEFKLALSVRASGVKSTNLPANKTIGCASLLSLNTKHQGICFCLKENVIIHCTAATVMETRGTQYR